MAVSQAQINELRAAQAANPYSTGNFSPATAKIAKSTTGSVLGANTYSGSGGSGQAAGSSASNNLVNNAPLQQAPQQPSIDFDALIAPALAGLEGAIGPLNESYNTNVQSINAAHDTQLQANTANIKGQQDLLGQAATSQQGQAQNAAEEARRQYAEIQQGLQSRYGGTTGTGAFASELAGRQTLQNMGQTNQQLSQALLQIDQKKQQVEEVGRIAAQQIEDQTQSQLGQAKSQLDSAIADIRRQQGALQSQKAEMAANAIQIYQNTVNNVNAQNAAFKQNLYVAQTQAAQQLELARQNGSQAVSQYSSTLPGIQTAQQTTPVGPTQTAQTNTPTGAGSLGSSTYSQLLKNYGLQ